MKRNLLIACALLCGGALSGSAQETLFELNFNNRNLLPAKAAGENRPIKPLTLDPAANFPAGVRNTAGFRLSDANTRNSETLTFTANRNMNFKQGTVSFYFKPEKWPDNKKKRFLHVYSPGKEPKGLLIYYFYVDEKGGYVSALRMENASAKEFVSVKIPAEEILKDTFQKIDVTWDGKKLTLYHNGDFQDEAELPAIFAEESAKPRSWGSLQILPVIISDGDDPQTRTVIDEIKIYDSALSADAIQKAYAQENGK